MKIDWLYFLKPVALLVGIILFFEVKDRFFEFKTKRRKRPMKEIATKVMDWQTVEEATAYFKGQEQTELGLLNRYELISLENLQTRLGCTKGELSEKIKQRLSQHE